MAGPKYKRYFCAYSDKMIVRALSTPTALLQTVMGAPFFAEVRLEDEILAIEFGQTTGDVAGRYGALIMAERRVPDFMRQLPEGTPSVLLGPRVLDPPAKDFLYLEDFQPDHGSIGDLGSALADTYVMSRIIPYRTPVISPSIERKLAEWGYPNRHSFEYLPLAGLPLQAFGIPARGERREVFGIPQQPRIHLHSFVNHTNDRFQPALYAALAFPASQE